MTLRHTGMVSQEGAYRMRRSSVAYVISQVPWLPKVCSRPLRLRQGSKAAVNDLQASAPARRGEGYPAEA